ncbi:MAG: hypothetical protein HYV09_40955 [Deltaproteobacteria bacterium]|nr:hypothetical protein [Deltaproteobacteria bacterium]
MADAKHPVYALSREPSAERIAEMRREADFERRLDRAEDLAEGREQGLAEARDRLRVSLRDIVVSFCTAFDIELDDERRAKIASLDEAGLSALLDALFVRRAWP